MDALALVQFIFEAGDEVVKRCEAVKQCHSEATRIALRTVRTLGALEGASGEFSGNVEICAGLNELKGTLVRAKELVKVWYRCFSSLISSLMALSSQPSCFGADNCACLLYLGCFRCLSRIEYLTRRSVISSLGSPLLGC